MCYVGQILEGPCEHVRGGGVHEARYRFSYQAGSVPCDWSIYTAVPNPSYCSREWCVGHHVIGSTLSPFSGLLGPNIWIEHVMWSQSRSILIEVVKLKKLIKHYSTSVLLFLLTQQSTKVSHHLLHNFTIKNCSQLTPTLADLQSKVKILGSKSI